MQKTLRRIATSVVLPIVFGGAVALALDARAAAPAARPDRTAKPTVVLVHGAFADGSSWNDVITRLQASGFPVLAVANPLRGVQADADELARILSPIAGPVVLVGHSYGGSVISSAANRGENVKALVFVAAFAPDIGESAGALSAKFPGSTLGSALAPPVTRPDGGRDLYIRQDRFQQQFAADLPAGTARLMAATQRPISEAALGEEAQSAAWRAIPSWFIFGAEDRNIPPAAMAFMAERAGSKRTVPVVGASHVVMMSHPREVFDLIVEASSSFPSSPTTLYAGR